jgi:hypothetical protein
MFRCREVYRDGTHCQEPVYANTEYCRWHLTLHRTILGAGDWHSIIGAFCLIMSANHTFAAVSLFWKLANSPSLESFLALYWSLSWAGWMCGFGAIWIGLRHLIWPKVVAVTIVMITVYFAISAAIGFFWPDWIYLAVSVFSEIASDWPHVLLATTCAFLAVYFWLVFSYTVLLRSIKKTTSILITGLYFVILSSFVLSQRAPLLPLVMCVLLFAWWLNMEYSWFEKVRDWIDSFRF